MADLGGLWTQRYCSYSAAYTALVLCDSRAARLSTLLERPRGIGMHDGMHDVHSTQEDRNCIRPLYQ